VAIVTTSTVKRFMMSNPFAEWLAVEASVDGLVKIKQKASV
jgi:hypothetical protein